MGIELNALTGDADARCPSDRNLPFFTAIEGSQNQELVGFRHTDFTSYNDSGFVQTILSPSLTQAPTGINDAAICQVKVAEVERDCSRSPDNKTPECMLLDF